MQHIEGLGLDKASFWLDPQRLKLCVFLIAICLKSGLCSGLIEETMVFLFSGFGKNL